MQPLALPPAPSSPALRKPIFFLNAGASVALSDEQPLVGDALCDGLIVPASARIISSASWRLAGQPLHRLAWAKLPSKAIGWLGYGVTVLCPNV
jgi:hypothetical protein